MSDKDKLAVAKEHVRANLNNIHTWVFRRSEGLPAELLKQEYWLLRDSDAPRPKKLSEAEQRSLLDAALVGDVDASRVLLDEVIDYLDQRLKLPDGIREYAIAVLQRDRIAITRKRGRKLVTNYTRDYLIAHWVAELKQFGFEPERNLAMKKRESGCSIVSKVLIESGVNGKALKEQGVVDIWRRFKRRPDIKTLIQKIDSAAAPTPTQTS